MAVNFYPPCPQPELTYGLPGHTDPNALTILLQDLGVAGLQVRKDGKWIAVNPHPNAFVINLGDQLQVPPSSFLLNNQSNELTQLSLKWSKAVTPALQVLCYRITF